jgi:hypothetical protein
LRGPVPSYRVAAAQAEKVQPKQVELLCHRTANEDVPENTLESLEQAALMGLVAAFQLWDRIGMDPSAAVKAIGSNLPQVADRAEWILVHGGPAVLPEVRGALGSKSEEVRARAIRIVAWQGDTKSLGTLRALQNTDIADADLIAWAIAKIASLHSAL